MSDELLSRGVLADEVDEDPVGLAVTIGSRWLVVVNSPDVEMEWIKRAMDDAVKASEERRTVTLLGCQENPGISFQITVPPGEAVDLRSVPLDDFERSHPRTPDSELSPKAREMLVSLGFKVACGKEET